MLEGYRPNYLGLLVQNTALKSLKHIHITPKFKGEDLLLDHTLAADWLEHVSI